MGVVDWYPYLYKKIFYLIFVNHENRLSSLQHFLLFSFANRLDEFKPDCAHYYLQQVRCSLRISAISYIIRFPHQLSFFFPF